MKKDNWFGRPFTSGNTFENITIIMSTNKCRLVNTVEDHQVKQISKWYYHVPCILSAVIKFGLVILVHIEILISKLRFDFPLSDDVLIEPSIHPFLFQQLPY